MRHSETRVLLPTLHLPKDLQLDVEQFLELEPRAGVLHGQRVLGEMHIDERVRKAHQPILPEKVHTDRVRHAAAEIRQQTGYHGAHGFGIDPHTLHLLRGVVVRLESLRHLRRDLRHRRQFRMNEIIDMVEPAGLTEEQVLDAALEFDVLYALEPDQFALVRAVEEHGAEPLRLAYTDRVPLGHLADDLHVRVLVVQFGDLIEPTTIDILVRVLAQQIHRCAYAQF